MPRYVELPGLSAIMVGGDLHKQNGAASIVNPALEIDEGESILEQLASQASNVELQNLDSFVGATIGNHRIFLAIVPFFSYYHSIYLRCLSAERGDGTSYIEATPRSRESHKTHTSHKGFSKPDADDFYGHTVSMSEKSDSPPWKSFKKLHKKHRAEVFGEHENWTDHPCCVFVAWCFWRYFSARSLDMSEFKSDAEYHSAKHVDVLNIQGELSDEKSDDMARIIGKGDPAARNLSKPSRRLACNFVLGCTQNIRFEEAKNACRLGWEHEHSRPQKLGGVDGIDSSSMCVHHNAWKADNPLFDSLTIYNMLTIGAFLG